MFHEMIVTGVTRKMLIRKMTFATTEVELIATQRSIGVYQKIYDDMAADFAGFTKKKASFEVNKMEPFDFLNDRTYLL